MKKSAVLLLGAIFFIAGDANLTRAQQPATTQPQKQTAPQLDEWNDDFAGDKLDETKWEKFTFEGGAGGKLVVKDGEVRIRSASRTRAGIRSKQTFSGDRWLVEARLAKVGAQLPEPGSNGLPVGFAALTIIFDGAGRNRIEWILNSNGGFEVWANVDGRIERLDNRKLGTKMKNPVMSVGRRGDEFLFIINDPKGKPEDAQVGMKSTIRNLPKTFHVMLYGFGSSENNWDAVRVVVPK
jgi:hypothetical protein